MCKIHGVRVPNARSSTNYVPLDHSQHPDTLASASEVSAYDPANLPLRTAEEMLNQAQEVQSARTVADGK